MIVALLSRFGLFALLCRFVDEYVFGFLDGLLFVEQHALEEAMRELRLGPTVPEYRLRPKTELADLRYEMVCRRLGFGCF